MKKLLKIGPNKRKSQHYSLAIRDLSRELLYLNRYVCILETAAGVSKDMMKVPYDHQQVIKSIINSAPGLAKTAQEKLIDIIQEISKTYNLMAANDQLDQGNRKSFAAKANLYQSVIKTSPPLAGTFLEHSILYNIG